MILSSPERLLRLSTGGWACGILGAAATHALFDYLEHPATVVHVATKAGLSRRGTQALLDGLLGLGLVTLADGRYHNTPEASAHLVQDKPSYVGGLAIVNAMDLHDWALLTDVATTGIPMVESTADLADNPFQEQLAASLAALSAPVAHQAADRLGLAYAGALSWLDVGGGSGVYSAIWLGLNREATAVQLDRANNNRVAKRFVGKFGVADRFTTIDGDFHTTDLRGPHDVIVYSHISRQESPESNAAMFHRFRKALAPGGTLVVNDFILNDDRTGHPLALVFHAQLVLTTKGGATWRRCDYRAWLEEAGFLRVSYEPTQGPTTLVYAS